MSAHADTAASPLRAAMPPAKANHAPAPTGSAGPGPVPDALGAVLRQFKHEGVWLVLFSMFANLLMLTPILYMLQVFDRVMTAGNTITLIVLTVLMMGLTGLMAFSEWMRSRLLVRIGARFDETLKRPVFEAAFGAQLRRAQRSPQQPLTDLNSVRQFLTGTGIFAILDTPWALVFIGVLFLMHPWLGLMSLGFCVVQLAIALTLQRRNSRAQRASQDLALESSQHLQTRLRNAETVESMGMLAHMRRQWMATHDRHMAGHHQVQDQGHRTQALLKWVQYTQQALMLSLGALLAIDGHITPGAMVAANALMGNALRPIGVLVQSWSQSIEARLAYRRLNELLAQVEAAPGTPPAPEVKGQLTLRGLQARSPDGQVQILKGLDAEFRPGEVVAILGPSGAGKSTLVRCLLGLWPNTQGEVLLDGQPLAAWPRDVLGPQVGYLPQDIELFDGTMAENIARFGDADPSDVIAAAQRAGIHEMVLRMAKGYDTPIGDGGAVLSGGQRQRLALARALLNQPRIVVLDEPSSNLDDAGEAALLKAVQGLKAAGSTVFMVVHQPHLLSVADRALVMEAGHIKQLATIQRQAAAPQPQPSKTA